MNRQENQTDKAIPNLYKMLGLEGPDASNDVIRAKIDRLRKKADAIAAKDSIKAEQAHKLVAVARKQLCDPSRKAKYDALWNSQFGGRGNQAASNSKVDTRQDALNPKFSALLPTGSPTAPFDIAAYMRNSKTPRYEREQFEQLVAAVAAMPTSPPVPNELRSDECAFVSVQEQAASSMPIPTPARGEPTRLGKQLREKRKKNFLIPVVGLLFCLAVVLGLIAFLLQNSRSDETLASDQQKKDSTKEPSKAPRPRRSGLPQVAMPTEDDSPPTIMDLKALPAGQQSADDVGAFMSDSPEMVSSQDEAADDSMDDGQRPVVDGLMKAPESSSAKSAESIEETLQGVLRLAAEYKYDEAVEKIRSARDRQLSDRQTTQLARVEAVVLLAQQAHASLLAKVQSMTAGESFLVGTSAQIGFVSGDSQGIAIRLRDQPREYTYAELPPGLLYALLDLSLDNGNPTALGARGAFVLLQPNRTDAMIRKSRELLVAAAGSGAFEEDLPAVIDDLAL